MNDDTIILSESGYDTGMTFSDYCELAAQHGDNPADYSEDVSEFRFVSVGYAAIGHDSMWDVPEGWPEDLPLWMYTGE